MKRDWLAATLVTGLSMSLVAGCGQTEFDDALGVTLEQVDDIRASGALTPQEKRDALAAYGLSPVMINGLLQDERLANQFGGDLSSAYDKVVNHQLTEMTADEIQYYGDATDVTTYDDEEALAILHFFADEGIDGVGEEGINSRKELEDYLDDSATGLPPEIDETNLRGVFITTSLSYVRDKLP
jgi:hypothetical protein